MTRTQIGYGKIGRSMAFDPKRGGFQGNPTCGQLLIRLARRNPEVDFILIGKNDGKLDAIKEAVTDGGSPWNVINPWEGQKAAGFAQKKDGEVVEHEDVTNFEADIIDLIAGLDGLVIHAGQHGTSHFPIPPAGNTWADCEEGSGAEMKGTTRWSEGPAHLTKPFVWARNYGAYMVKGMNVLGDKTLGQAPVVYVCEDSRNHLKARDIKWPSGEDMILAQRQFTKEAKHQRFQDPRSPAELGYRARLIDEGEVWMVEQRYVYGGLEMMTCPDGWEMWGTTPFEDRIPHGVGTTSHKRGNDNYRRSRLVVRYSLAAFPDCELQGKWDEASLADLPEGVELRLPNPNEFGDDLARWRTTLVLPVAGTGWSTAKPWQCAASNTVAFHVSKVDDQGWMLPSRIKADETKHVGSLWGTPFYSVRDDWTEEDLFLARWTRVLEPEEFAKGAKKVAESKDLWTQLVTYQRDLLKRRWDEWRLETMIEERLGL